MNISEFIGLPGSGKSTLLKKILNKNLYLKKNSHKFINYLYDNLEFKNYNQNIISFFTLKILIKKKNLLFFDHTLNKKNFKNLFKEYIRKVFLEQTLNSFTKQDKKFYKSFNQLLNFSSHSYLRKERMKMYFILTLVSYRLIMQSKKNIHILDDEGFYQKVLISYKDFSKNKKKILRFIKIYLDNCPNINSLIYVNNLTKKIMNFSKNRKIGFNYSDVDLKNNLKNWTLLVSFIIKYSKKEKHNVYKNKNKNKIKINETIKFILKKHK